MAALQGGMAIYMGLGPIHTLGHVFADSPIHHGALITASAPAVMRFYAHQPDDTLNDRLERVRETMGLAAGTDLAGAIVELNTRLGLALPAFSHIICIFLFKASFDAIPPSLIQAAKIDGVPESRIVLRIMLPLAKPAVATTASHRPIPVRSPPKR